MAFLTGLSFQIMTDDPRIKRILKRYPKADQFPDGIMDVSSLGLDVLLSACRGKDARFLAAPRELDDEALASLSQVMGIDFDRQQYDYFLHSYVRSEFVSGYYEDPTITSSPAPEDGPPSKIPLPKGQRWRPTRPQDGKENYEAWDFIEDDTGAV